LDVGLKVTSCAKWDDQSMDFFYLLTLPD
jgi:hypothetical protein